MGEVLLICSLITLIAIVYFVYIKDKEERDNSNLTKKSSLQNNPYYRQGERYYSKVNEYDYRHSKYDKSGDYLKFLKYKNTPPPQDLQPKKLKYENYYNYNFYDNHYNYNTKQINVLTPTPFKNDQVKAGNAYYNYVQNPIRENNLEVVKNNNYKHEMNKLPENNNYNYRGGSANYFVPQKVENHNDGNYQSKYPVELTYKKRESANQLIKENTYATYNYMNQNNRQAHQTYQVNAGINPTARFSINYPQNFGNNNVNYKVINAEEFLKKQNLMADNSNNKANVLSISPMGIFQHNIKEEAFRDDSYLKYRNKINNNNYGYAKLPINHNPNLVPYNNNNNNKNLGYNNQQIKPVQVNNLDRAHNLPSQVNPDDDKIIPRKLRFSDASFNKFNISNKKSNNEDGQVWCSPLELN